MKKAILFLLMFSLLLISFINASDYLLNFSQQTQQYNKTYSDIVSISEFPEFIYIENNFPNSIYTLINSNIFSKIAFYKNASGSFDSGYYGIYKPNVFFKNKFPSGYLNKSLLYIEQFSLSAGSASFILLDLKLNQSAYNYNNKSTSEIFFKVIDRQSGITDYFNVVYLSGNIIKYSQQFLIPNSTDLYNYTLIVNPNITFYFDRFIIRQSVNVESGVIQDLGIESVLLKNISLVENKLPEFNFSVSGDFCINTTQNIKNQLTFVYLNITASDFEGDTILYSLEKQTENLKEVNTYHEKGSFTSSCGLYIPLIDIFIFENSKIFCKGNNPQITIDLNPQLYNNYLNNRCKIDFTTTENNSNIFIDKFSGNWGDNFMLVIPDNCSGLKKEAVYKLETGLKDFEYETQFYYERPLQYIKITFYNSLNPEIIIGNFSIFTLLDNVVLQNKNLTNILQITDFSNYSYDYKFIGIKFNYDYETNIFNITISDILKNVSYSVLTNGSLNSNSTKYLKYIGFGTAGLNTNYRLLQEIFTISAYYDKLGFSETQPNNVSYTELRNDYLTLFITDNINKDLDLYSSKSQAINIKSCEFKTENPNLENFDINNFCPQYSNTAVNNFICMMRTPAIIGYQLDTLHFLNDILFLFLVFMCIKLYINFSKDTTGNLDTAEIIKRIFLILFVIVFCLYYFFMFGDKSLFVSVSLIGLLLLGFTINKLLNMETGSTDETLVYSMIWFNLLSFIYFSFVQTPIYSNFGIQEFPTFKALKLDVFVLKDNFILAFSYIFNIFFFTIPDVNGFLNLIFVVLKVLSIISLFVVLGQKIFEILKNTIDLIKGFLGV